MHRCYVDQQLRENESYRLSAEEARHVSRVLRMTKGDEVELLDGEGLFSGEIEAVLAEGVTVKALAMRPSPECETRLTLYQGLPKLDKLELIVQKATELGAYRIAPVEMERSVAKSAREKGDRYARIALEAAKQAGRAHVPAVDAPAPLGKLTEDMKQHSLLLVAWEEAQGVTVGGAIREYIAREGACPQSVGIIIGPEGGISRSEIDRLTAVGAVPVTLGRRILRTETAGLCALALALGALGDM